MTDATASAGPSTSGKKKGDPLVEKKDAPWVEKYRPKTLDDVAAHKEIIDTSGLAVLGWSTHTHTRAHLPLYRQHNLAAAVLARAPAATAAAAATITTNHKTQSRS